MKKKILLLLIFLLISGCTKDKSIPKQETYENAGTFEYGSLIKYSDILKNKNIINDDYLNTINLGNNTVTIFYNENGEKEKKNYSYKIVDTTSPLVWMSDHYNIIENDSESLTEKIMVVDNYDRNVNSYIKGDYNYDVPGTYPLQFIAKDSSGNKEEINFNLNVLSKEKQNNNNNTTESQDDHINFSDAYNEYKTNDTLIGIDVSTYQGEIDWHEVKNAGVEFVMIRMGRQTGYKEGLEYDKYFKSNIEGALQNNIKVGLYFYSYATTKKEGIKQARFLLDSIKDYKIEMPIAYDWENFKKWREISFSIQDLKNASYGFQDTIKKAGYYPVQYGSAKYLNYFWSPMKYDTWLAQYLPLSYTPSYENPYTLWQFSNKGIVPGIKGDVDLDIYYIKK